MQVRCPSCNESTDVSAEAELSEIICPCCGGKFSLLAESTKSFFSGEAKRFGRFELIEQLGIGAFGAVWLAHDTELDRQVAIKIPRKGQLTAEESEQFVREARAAAQLRHPNIVSVHEVGREDGQVYIVSDYIEGLTLADWLVGKQLTAKLAADLCSVLADALEHAHDSGIIHRDLKPTNILMDRSGEPHIMDFGLAKRQATDVTMTMDGKILGTPAYMSPEQAKGDAHRADRRSDVYSLGVILYEVLTGHRPFRGNVRMLLLQVIQDDPPSPRKLQSSLSPDLETVCLKCLEKDPQKRFAKASELADELRRFLRGEPIRSRPLSKPQRVWRWCRRNPVIAGLCTLVALMLLVLAIGGPWVAWKQADLASKADMSERSALELLYTSDINSGFAALTTQNLARLELLLRRQIPGENHRPKDDPRGFEWFYLLQRLVADSPPTFHCPSGIDSALFSKLDDGLVVSLDDGSVFKLNKETAKALKISPRLDDAKSRRAYAPLCFSNDGRLLCIGAGTTAGDEQSKKGTVKFLEYPSLKPYRMFEVDYPVSTVALSDDGKRAAAGGLYGTVQVWDLDSEHVAYKHHLHSETVNALDFGENGDSLFTASDDKTCKCLTLGSPVKVRQSMEHLANVNSVKLSPDGTTLVTASELRVRFWRRDKDTGQWSSDSDDLRLATEEATFSPDGETLATAHYDHLVRLWDVPTHKLIRALNHEPVVTSLDFDATGAMLISGSRSKTLNLWDLNMQSEPELFQGSIQENLGLAASDEFIATSGEGNTVMLWNLKTRKLDDLPVRHSAPIVDIAMADSGGLLATASLDHKIEIWDMQNQTRQQVLHGHSAPVNSIAFTGVANQLASCSESGELIVWDWRADRKTSLSMTDRGYPLTSVAVSRRGILAVGGGVRQRFGSIELWDVSGSAMKCIQTLHHPDSIRCLTFSPSGRLLAAGDFSSKAKIWDVQSPESDNLKFIDLDAGHAVSDAAFAEDEKTLATTAGVAIKLWRVASGEELATIDSDEELEGVAFTRSGMVTASEEGPIRLWSTATRENAQLLLDGQQRRAKTVILDD